MPFHAEMTERSALDFAIDSWWEATTAIEKYQQVKDSASAFIVSHLPVGENYGGLAIAKGRRRFSPELAARELTPAQFAAICEFSPSPKLARDRLEGELVDKCYQDVGAPYVRRA